MRAQKNYRLITEQMGVMRPPQHLCYMAVLITDNHCGHVSRDMCSNNTREGQKNTCTDD